MFDDALRPIKDRFLVPVSRSVGLQVSPTAMTLLSLATGLVSAALLLQQRYGSALAAWLVSRLLDGLDGTIARVHARQSDFGAYLDILCDFVVYLAVPIALVLGRGATTSTLLALVFLLASFYLNAASWMYLAAILEKRRVGASVRGEQTSVSMPDGLIGGSETIAFYSAFILLPQHLVALYGLMAALVVFTAAQRLVWAWRRL